MYIAIEHNTKYLTSRCVTIETERNSAVKEVAQLKASAKKKEEDTAQMARQFKVLQKESEQLVVERKKNAQAALDLTKAKEKEDSAT